MKNYLKNITLLLAAVLLPTIAAAHDFEVDGIYYNIYGINATVSCCGSYGSEYSNEYSGSVVIPESVTYNGVTYPVTAIGNQAFQGCVGLTSIIIPNSVISIGNSSFCNCEGLKSIEIPNSVTTIDAYAFESCYGLTNIKIGNSVTKINFMAFYGCRGITSIEIPNSVRFIGYEAFENCTNLASIVFPNSHIRICRDAFSKTGWYNNQPDGLVYAGRIAYKYKGNMPSGATITLQDGTLGIANEAFDNCNSLTSIELPNTLISIGFYSFRNCSSLTSLDIPNSVLSIDFGAFMGCSNLSNIIIPNSVNTIESLAFDGTPWYNNQSDGLVYAGLVAYKYKGTMPSGSHITLKEGTKGIAGSAFYDCRGLTSINNLSSISYIGDYAFNGCSGLMSIDIPNLVTSIGNRTFLGCRALANVTIPNSIISIDEYAFGLCTGLTKVIIPNSVTVIGNNAFRDCNNLKSIEIGNHVTEISQLTFSGCTALHNVYCYSPTPSACYNEEVFSTYSANLHVPSSSLAAYFTAPCWRNFENISGDAIAPLEIVVSENDIELQLGEQFQLTATVKPNNASNKEVNWISTDKTVANVDNGIVTAVSYGECDIIALCFGMQAICHVSVTNRIELDQQEAMILPNHMLTLTPTAPTMPDGFTVTSSEPTVAAARVMNGKVQVVGIKEGTTTITVGSADCTVIPATCLVTVYTEPGDLNSDGFVTISDVTSLINYLLSDDNSQISVKNADVNGDDKINISDVTALINNLLSGD